MGRDTSPQRLWMSAGNSLWLPCSPKNCTPQTGTPPLSAHPWSRRCLKTGISWNQIILAPKSLMRIPAPAGQLYPGGAMVKNPPANARGARDAIPGLGRSPGGEKGSPVQYSFLENSMDRGVWWDTVRAVTKSWTQLINWVRAHTHKHTHTHTHTHIQSNFTLVAWKRSWGKYLHYGNWQML